MDFISNFVFGSYLQTCRTAYGKSLDYESEFEFIGQIKGITLPNHTGYAEINYS